MNMNMKLCLPIFCMTLLFFNAVIGLAASRSELPVQKKCFKSLSLGESLLKFIEVDTDNPLNYSVIEVENWINGFKSKLLRDLYDADAGVYAKHLKQHNGMTVQRRQELAYGVQVRPVAQGSHIYLAVFWSENNLNMSQMRTELHAFGGGDSVKGRIPKGTELFYHVSCEACRGLNLTGKAFLGFQKELRKQKIKMYPEEKAFFKGVIRPLLNKHPDGKFNLISIQAKAPALDTIVHEGHHAMYDSVPAYKAVLLKYWDKHIRDQLDEEVSNSFNPKFSPYELMQDEFFAYLLQPSTFGQWNPIAKFQNKHLKKVLKALSAAGFKPPFYPKD